MKWILITLVFGAGLLWATKPARPHPAVFSCTKSNITKFMLDKFRERSKWQGTSKDLKKSFSLFENGKGNWTILMELPNGTWCIVDSGINSVGYAAGDPS